MSRILIAAGLLLASTPAFAGDQRVYRTNHTSGAAEAGCTVRQYPQPAGKTFHAPSIVTCPASVTLAEVERRAGAPIVASR